MSDDKDKAREAALQKFINSLGAVLLNASEAEIGLFFAAGWQASRDALRCGACRFGSVGDAKDTIRCALRSWHSKPDFGCILFEEKE